MAIISKLRRSTTANQTKRKPVKKALIVGIQYEKQKHLGDLQPLSTPHKDARDWRDTLKSEYKYQSASCVGFDMDVYPPGGRTEEYGYLDSEITLMLDDEGTTALLLPTRENLVRLLLYDILIPSQRYST